MTGQSNDLQDYDMTISRPTRLWQDNLMTYQAIIGQSHDLPGYDRTIA